MDDKPIIEPTATAHPKGHDVGGAKRQDLQDHFDDLVNYLAVVDRQVRSGGDQIEACLNTLTAVKRFIETDPAVRKMKALTSSLATLSFVLKDIQVGSRPPLIFSRAKKCGGPTEPHSKSTLKAVCAACLQAMMSSGIQGEEAARHIAHRLKTLKVKLPKSAKEPSDITAKQIARWRYEMTRTASLAAKRIFWGLVLHPALPFGVGRRKEAEKAVGVWLRALSSHKT